MIYDKRNRALAIGSAGRPGRLIQVGMRHRLLCKACEGFLNDTYEQPFRKMWYEEGRIPMVSFGPFYNVTIPSFSKFKLFLLSVFWRAGVCRDGAFSEVDLRGQEEVLRRMLRDEDAGRETDFPVIAAVALSPKSLQVSTLR